MLGAIVGDISGSRFEWHNHKSKDFELLTYKCRLTDDTIMTLAIAKAIMASNQDYSNLGENAIYYMQKLGRQYPNAGYGGRFFAWLHEESPQPYNSWGNGAAMRVSPCGFAANTIEEAKSLAKAVTEVTHNHPEGIKAAEAIAVAIFMALHGSNILEIQDCITSQYYPIDFTLDQIRDEYTFDVSCQGSVPQAFAAFFESTGFEDAIRNAISIGGDSDTIAAITGSIAEAYYGIPGDIRNHALTFLDEELLKVLTEFENRFPTKVEVSTGKTNYSIPNDFTISSGEGREQILVESASITDRLNATLDTYSDEITSSKLFSHLYGGASILHGYIAKENYRSYLIPLLFYKRISDVYDEETEECIRMYGERGALFMGDAAHTFTIPEGCHWNDLRSVSENVGKAIADALVRIEQANPNTLGGVFSSFDDAEWANKIVLSDELLKNLIEHMSSISVGNNDYSADVMGDAYEYLLKQFAENAKKNGGEFYTPRAIVKLLVKILDPQPGQTVYDPACGTGGMLIESIRHMKNKQMTYGKIFGQEINMTTSAIARMNLYLHGAHDFSIEQGDTLRYPKFLKGGKLRTFDNVIANPPFGLSEWGANSFETDPYGRNIWGSPTDSNADFAWIQHMVASMNPESGKCVVIMPQGVLFHSGKEGTIREKLILSDKVEAVITFVGGLFFGAGVSACALYLNNKKAPSRKGKILLIDGSNIYTPKRAQKILSDDNVDRLYELFSNYKDEIGFSKVVTIDDVASKEYSLAVNTYIERPPVETKDPKEVRKEYFEAVEAVKECENRLLNLLKEGGYIE